MWCDSFDLDLFKVLPEARELIAPAREIQLYTFGHAWTDGTLNGPSVWNGDRTMVAFFSFGYAQRPDFYYTDAGAVACTFEEALRDCWVHSYGIFLWPPFFGQPYATLIWDSFRLRQHFDALMYDTRGWKKLDEAEREHHRGVVLQSITTATERMQWAHRRYLDMAKSPEA